MDHFALNAKWRVHHSLPYLLPTLKASQHRLHIINPDQCLYAKPIRREEVVELVCDHEGSCSRAHQVCSFFEKNGIPYQLTQAVGRLDVLIAGRRIELSQLLAMAQDGSLMSVIKGQRCAKCFQKSCACKKEPKLMALPRRELRDKENMRPNRSPKMAKPDKARPAQKDSPQRSK